MGKGKQTKEKYLKHFGVQYNYLTPKDVIYLESCGKMRANFVCDCVCGNEHITLAYSVLNNLCKSCGCRSGERKRDKENDKWKGYGDLTGFYFNKVKRRAAERGLDFSITIEYAWNLYLQQDKKCALTGWEIYISPDSERTKRKGEGIQQTASLDRIDSSKGYIDGNVQWVFNDTQKLKMDLKEDYLFEIIERIVKKWGMNQEM